VKIPCPACAAKYSVADDKIQSRLAKIRCRKCGVTIVIDGTVDPVNVYVGEGGQKTAAALSLPGVTAPSRDEASPESGSPDSAGPAPHEYAVDIADNDQRNMSLERIVAAYNSGIITAETYIWKEGMADWQMLAEVPEVYSALHAAARTSGVPGGASFGRQAPDPFGRGGDGDLGSAQDQLLAGTGARNESSVLFSLSALTGGTVTAGSSSMGPSRPAKRSEDSGLIDLQALTAQAESPASFSSPGPGASFGGPALISAPLGGVTSSTMNGAFDGYSKRSSSKTGFIIGGVVLAALAIGGVIFMIQSGDTTGTPAGTVAVSEDKEPVKSEAHKASAAEPAEPAAEAEPEAQEEPVAPAPKKSAPAAAAAAAEPDEPAAAPVRKVTHTASSRAPAPRRSTQAAAPAARPTPKPAPEPAAEAPKPAAPPPPAPGAAERKKKACDCKPADLMCAMRCSAAK
jgi:predicted Zn finger-like uncharacterized protein